MNKGSDANPWEEAELLDRFRDELERCEEGAWTWMQVDVEDIQGLLAIIERQSRALTKVEDTE